MSTAQKLLTAEEYFDLVTEYECSELIRGEVVPMNPPGHRHGKAVLQAGHLLKQYVENHDVGHVSGADAGVITERDPDTVRGADVMFHSYDRLPRDTDEPRYPQSTPNIVFEIRSPSDRWTAIHEKVAEYLEAGVECVCVLVPENQTAVFFYPDANPVVLEADDELTLPPPLDGFRVPVRRFFE